MMELMWSIPSVLLCFKDLNAISKFSVVKSKLLMCSLEDFEYSMQLAETGGFFFQKCGAYICQERI